MKILQAIIFVLSISACSAKSDQTSQPKRLSAVPEKAFWIGGADGGNWYLIHEIHAHTNNAVISVYNEDGSLIIKKRFIVICRLDRPIIWIEHLKQQINGFDGKKILLQSPTGKEICWMQ